ncbi:polyketide synthase dehydratase domain-containing protein, partial [Micromonospora eburnea]
GTISTATHPWLADHAITGTVLLPGTAFLELALHAAYHTDCNHIEELNVHEPLTLPERGGVQIHVTVGPPTGDGTRDMKVESRRLDADAPDTPWTQNITAVLGVDDNPGPRPDDGPWDPAGSPIDIESFYDNLSDHGLDYGPVFQGLKSAWRAGDVFHAELELSGDESDEGFIVHPALLDAAIQTIFLTDAHPLGTGKPRGDGSTPQIPVPFSWSGVRVAASATATTTLRVRMTLSGDSSMALHLSDAYGHTICSVDTLTVRPVAPDKLESDSEHRHNFHVVWERLGVVVPDEVAVPVGWALLGSGGSGSGWDGVPVYP